jgi:transcription antitermination factor NusG
MRAARRLATPDDFRQDNRYIKEGPAIFLRKPVVNSLLFVRTTDEGILQVSKAYDGKGFVYKTVDRKKPYVIPDREMAIFRMVTSSGAGGLKFFSDESLTRYKQGDRVRVTEGLLKGAEGYVKRIGKDRRLLVSIEGFVAVATSFIPLKYLEKVPENAG